MAEAKGLRGKMADVMACLVVDGEYSVVDEQRPLNVINSSKSSNNVNRPQSPEAHPAARKRYAPPPPQPTTKAQVEPDTQPTTSSSIDSLEPTFGERHRRKEEDRGRRQPFPAGARAPGGAVRKKSHSRYLESVTAAPADRRSGHYSTAIAGCEDTAAPRQAGRYLPLPRWQRL
ncbi:unnamed protein product [Cylicocyclus nassatus]|uniref:Uncharacterized protein n=1 Tax=Cylicocyclus nassatus TaxID=53992 RepID=A0AA36GW40_CYLNA|nr:unnamed protein product [Cylicocyclus nassatus]